MIYNGESATKKTTPMAFHRVGARVSFDETNLFTHGKVVAIGKSIEVGPLQECIQKSKIARQ